VKDETLQRRAGQSGVSASPKATPPKACRLIVIARESFSRLVLVFHRYRTGSPFLLYVQFFDEGNIYEAVHIDEVFLVLPDGSHRSHKPSLRVQLSSYTEVAGDPVLGVLKQRHLSVGSGCLGISVPVSHFLDITLNGHLRHHTGKETAFREHLRLTLTTDREYYVFPYWYSLIIGAGYKT
jgi:hypothetical protein